MQDVHCIGNVVLCDTHLSPMDLPQTQGRYSQEKEILSLLLS
jgi:hypothetical protein